MAAGLPVLYHNEGGSIPEYVGKRGIGYSGVGDLEQKISQLVASYKELRKHVLDYEENISHTIEEYCDLIWKIS